MSINISLEEPPTEAEFCARVIVVRERVETKEQEINGAWMTETKMKKDFSSTLICITKL